MLNDNTAKHSGTPVQHTPNSQVAANRPAREPLAIIGMGCHFPGGATSPAAFWNLLCRGVDATIDVPSDRWDARKFYDPDTKKSGKMNTFHGGYLERLDQFDAPFFGISPREAMWLDPQQRMLLRVTWEAMEDAGLVADRLEGSNTGVFIGGFTLDYQLMQNFGIYSRYELQSNSATGMMMTMLANRISYVFGFHGPSMAVDTACSGSLVAVHLACQSIWNGECSLAIAGGANAMIAPTMTIAEAKGGFLSSDGRCKTFDAAANGYARGEGAGVVLIKPLGQAQADGDPVYAVIRGTAVSQDGHTNGITVPNGEAQQRAMCLAYERAGVSPKDIQYVEAHGTGTPVGDPIEARAIGTVVSEGRPADAPCVIGSVKTNIGHLEAAAGVAGLIKTALILKHKQIPPNLHFHNPNPAIPFEELKLRVPTALQPFPAADRPALAGINSFGFGGTNAHVVLEEAPRVEEPATPVVNGERTFLVPISTRSAEALTESAQRYRDFLATAPASLPEIAFSAATRRAHHDHRLALVARTKDEAIARLDDFLTDTPHAGVVAGRTPQGERPKLVFVCSGMGPQWWAMGRELLETEPVFRAAVERIDAAFQRHAGWSILDELLANEAESRMEETEVAQPANFAIQVALAELWRSWGIVPDAIVGHSAGEAAAQYLAGALSFEEAIRVIYHRSRLQQRTSGQGRMLAVGMTPETLNQAVNDAGEGVSIAAINSPSAVTVVGEAAVLESMASQLETFGVFHRFLVGKVPYHSHFMDPLRAELLESLAAIQPRSAAIPLYSTVTGTRVDGRGVDAQYWWQNVRGTVLFASAMSQVIQDGYNVFVELGPHPVLASSMSELLAQQGQTGTVLCSLRRKANDHETMLGSLGALYTLGYPVAWDTFFDTSAAFVRLPAYPWQLKPYWTESVESQEDRALRQVHPLLGQRMTAGQPTWELELNGRLLPYLPDHRIQDNVLLPGAAYVELALAAAREVFGQGSYVLESLEFRKALFLPDVSDPRLQTVLNPERATVEIYSYTPTNEPCWALHAVAKLRQRQPSTFVPRLDIAAISRAYTLETTREQFYQQTMGMGFLYGPTFQGVAHVQAGADGVLGRLEIPAALLDDLHEYGFHPALLDAAFQVILAAPRPVTTIEQTTYLPVGVDRIQVLGRPTSTMFAHASMRQADARLVVGDITITDEAGNLLVDIEGFHAQSLESSVGQTPERIDRNLYEMAWLKRSRGDDTAMETPLAVGEGSWLIFMDQSGVGAALVRMLYAQGQPYVAVAHGTTDEMVTCAPGQYMIDATNPAHFERLFTTLAADGRTYSRLVHLWALDADFSAEPSVAALERAQTIGVESVMYLIQTLAHSGWTQLPHIWLVTQQAQPVGDTPAPLAIEQAPLWGIGRVIGHQEFSSMWGGLIDLQRGDALEQAALLYEEIANVTVEDQVAFRGGERYVVRLLPSTRLQPPLPPTFRPDGSYIITGGLGSLGLLVARWMAAQGARRLILMGRTKLPARRTWHELAADHPQRAMVQAIQELENQGVTIHHAAVDVADEEQLSTFLANYRREGWPPIRGVIHTAGVVQDELLIRMKAESMQRVLRPKVLGGWLLHTLLADQPLDFFVLFSSVGSVIASLGQGNYASGNAFLDALAHHRQALGLPALSIGWGPWSVGMVEQLSLEQFYAKRGIELISSASGMQIMARLMSQRPAQLTAITANWATAREASPLRSLPPMFSLLGEESEDTTAADTGSDELLALLSAAPVAERTVLVETHLHDLVARVLKFDPTQFSKQDSLTSLGIDSMMAIEVKSRIEASVKVDISVLELLQGATVTQLATRILTMLQLNETATVVEEEAAPSVDDLQFLIDQADSDQLERLLAELEQTTEVAGFAE